MSRIWLHSGRIVTPTEIVNGGSVLIDDGVIAKVTDGTGPPPDRVDEAVDLAGGPVLPGFIDLHVHGGGGATFDDGRDSIATGLATHRANGTTRSLISLVTASPDDMEMAVRAAADHAADDPFVLGLHLEGPFLSVDRRGVHDPRSLRHPDPVLLQRLLRAGEDRVKVVTIAPELPGGLDLLRQVVDATGHAAIGHSDAGYDIARRAFEAGADLVTHAFNGMRPIHHRDPAIIGAAMDAGVVFEAVNDGVHLHEATVRLLRAIAPGRVALITDAMAAACAPDGTYRLGAFDVRVTHGQARLADGTIAGSTLTMGVAVQRAVRIVGMPLVDAANAASLVPATYLGVGDRFGSIQPGRAGDLVFPDAEFNVRAVMVGGRWLDARRP